MLEFLIKYANKKNIQYKLLTKDDVKDYDDLDNIMIYMHNIEELIGILLNIQPFKNSIIRVFLLQNQIII